MKMILLMISLMIISGCANEEIEYTKLSENLINYLETNDDKNIEITVFLVNYSHEKLVSMLLQHPEYFDENGKIIPKNDMEYMDEAIRIQTEAKRELFEEINGGFLDSLNIKYDVMYKAKYSPHIRMVVNRNDLNKITKINSVMLVDYNYLKVDGVIIG